MTESFRLLCADPPWRLSDQLPGPKRGASKHYATLSLNEIREYPLPPLADDALLLLWRLASMGEEAYWVARAWGFTPKAELVWVKTTKAGKPHTGMGHYTRGSHETCLIAARGRAHTLIQDRSIRSVFEAPRGVHSEKPDRFYLIAEQLFPGPRVELFARRRREGWTQYGLELPGGEVSP